jgi:hypothetical protein
MSQGRASSVTSMARRSRGEGDRAAHNPMPRPADRLPDPPASLDSKHAAELTAQTKAALRRQRCELAASIDKAFEHVPWPLRGAMRRALGA